MRTMGIIDEARITFAKAPFAGDKRGAQEVEARYDVLLDGEVIGQVERAAIASFGSRSGLAYPSRWFVVDGRGGEHATRARAAEVLAIGVVGARNRARREAGLPVLP